MDGAWSLAGSLIYGPDRISIARIIALRGVMAEAHFWTYMIDHTETGAGGLNLTSRSQFWNWLDTGLGLALARTALTGRGKITLEGRECGDAPSPKSYRTSRWH